MDQSERPKISFSDNSYEEYAGSVASALNERFVVIEQAKAVYDWAVLVDILGDYASISEAKTASYEKHKQDLAYLKKLVRSHLGADVYKEQMKKLPTTVHTSE